MRIKKTPINRFNSFFGEEEFTTDIEMAQEYLEHDVNMSIWLYRIDKVKSNIDDVYGEVNKEHIVLQDPVELSCLVEIKKSENKSYNDDNSLIYEEYGNIYCHFYENVLKTKNIEIHRGDYLGYHIDEDTLIFFEVSDNNMKNFASSQTWGGYKPLIRTVEGVPTDMSQFEII